MQKKNIIQIICQYIPKPRSIRKLMIIFHTYMKVGRIAVYK